MAMRMGGLALLVFAVFLGAILMNRHWLESAGMFGVALSFAAPAFGTTLEIAGHQIRNYSPTSRHDAKIANEKIKMLAASINAVALGIAVIWIIQPTLLLKFPINDVGSLLATIFAFYVHTQARRVLGYMKDEDAAAVEGMPLPAKGQAQ